MIVEINRTGKKLAIMKRGNERSVTELATQNGYERIDVLDIENHEDIRWEGIEFNRLLAKDGILFRFNEWLGKYPFEGIVIEEIGKYGE